MRDYKLTTTLAQLAIVPGFEGQVRKISGRLWKEKRLSGDDQPINLLYVLDTTDVDTCLTALTLTREDAAAASMIVAGRIASHGLEIIGREHPEFKEAATFRVAMSRIDLNSEITPQQDADGQVEARRIAEWCRDNASTAAWSVAAMLANNMETPRNAWRMLVQAHAYDSEALRAAEAVEDSIMAALKKWEVDSDTIEALRVESVLGKIVERECAKAAKRLEPLIAYELSVVLGGG